MFMDFLWYLNSEQLGACFHSLRNHTAETTSEHFSVEGAERTGLFHVFVFRTDYLYLFHMVSYVLR